MDNSFEGINGYDKHATSIISYEDTKKPQKIYKTIDVSAAPADIGHSLSLEN